MSLTGQGQPIGEYARADILDALRGFALLGIFISHVPVFSNYSFMSREQTAALDTAGLDVPLAIAQHFLIRGKFFSLFSLLFGIGFAIQLESAHRREANFVRHFMRRLAVLFLIGLVHAFLWYGDILKDYALLGFILIFARNWTTLRIAVITSGVFVLRLIWPVLIFGVVKASGMAAGGENPGADFNQLTSAFYGSDPGSAIVANFALLKMKAMQIVYDGKAVSILSMFFIGVLIGRIGIYRDIARHQKLLLRIILICAPIGIVGNAILIPLHDTVPGFPPTGLWIIEQMLFAIAVPALTLAYAGGFALLWIRSRHFLSWLAPAGRMALTTYVSQTLIGIGLFYGIGMSYSGRVSLAGGTLLALFIFLSQCAVSSIWLRVFYIGPIEWVWRRATYGKSVPFRRESS